MDNINPIITILVTAITVLGSSSAWRYYEKRASKKDQLDDYVKSDYKERIIKLEALLERTYVEKEELRKIILDMTAQIAQLKVKVEFLEHENDFLSRSKHIDRPLDE